jgi:hypothetical protein
MSDQDRLLQGCEQEAMSFGAFALCAGWRGDGYEGAQE